MAYRASWADRRAWGRSLRPKLCPLACHAELRWRIAQKLALQWSLKQITGWLKQQFPADPGMQVSHETIYRGHGRAQERHDCYQRAGLFL
jgi:IS30 family transposase